MLHVCILFSAHVYTSAAYFKEHSSREQSVVALPQVLLNMCWHAFVHVLYMEISTLAHIGKKER